MVMGVEKGVGFPITAGDQFSGAFDKLKGRVTEAQSSFDRLKSIMTAAFLGISIAGIASMVTQAMDAADQMGKMAQKTGIATEQLSKLAYGAKLADVDLDTFGKGMKAFSAKLVEASDKSSQAAKIFKAMGVDVNAGPAKAVEQFADSVSKLGDGEVKTTLATEMLSKVGMGMIPWLNEGAKGMRKAADEAQRLGLVIGAEAAAAAQQFNDNMKALSSSSQAFGISLMNSLGPALINATSAMKEALIEGGKLQMLWVGLGAFGAFMFTDDMLSQAEKYRKELRGLQGDLESLKAAQAQGPGILEKIFGDQSGKILERITETEQKIKGVRAALMDLISPKAPAKSDPLAPQNKALEEMLKKLLAAGNGTKDLTSESNSLIATLEKELAKVSNLTGQHKKLAEVTIDIAKLKKEGKVVDEARIKLLANEIDRQAELTKILKQAIEAEDAAITSHKANEQAVRDMIGQLARGNKDLEFENSLIGLGTKERELAIAMKQKELAIDKARGTGLEGVVEKLEDERIALLKVAQTREQQVTLWSDLADRGSQFFVDLLTNGRNAFKSLGESLKQFAAELLAVFAKRWILQMVAGLTGSSALSAAAGAVGQGTTAGAASNWISSGLSATSWGSSLTGFGEGLSMGWQSGMAAPGAGAGEQFGAWLSGAAGPLLIFAGAVVAGIAAMQYWQQGWRDAPSAREGGIAGFHGARLSIASYGLRLLGFSDRDAFTMAGGPIVSRVFGHTAPHADAYGIRGAVGGGGVTGENWQDWSQRGGLFSHDIRNTEVARFSTEQGDFFQQFMRGLGKVTDTLGSLLGVNASTTLSGYNKPFNFQLNENGTPLTDEAIAKMFNDLFGSVLQDQVAMLFDAADRTELAKYVRELKGSGEEITSMIKELVGVMGGLKALNAKGLSVEALMAWQREGESLGQAFQRVAGQFAQFDDAFMSEAQKFDAAQNFVTTTFGKLGIAIPDSTQSFYDLVHGLDLSTKAGRDMFDTLMSVAPAFLAVHNAAGQMMSAFDALMGRLRPGYTAGRQDLELTSGVTSFMNANAWTHGMTADQVIAALRTISREDFAMYSSSNQRLILSILDLDDTVNHAGTTIAAATQQAVDWTAYQMEHMTEADRLWYAEYGPGGQERRAARTGLGGYLSGLLVGDKSPLDPMEKLKAAQNEYERMLALAKTNDVVGLQGLQGAHNAYLDIARQLFGSTSPFIEIFTRTFNEVAGVAGVEDYNTRMLDLQTKQHQTQLDIYSVLIDIRDQGPRTAAIVADVTEEGATKVVRAIDSSSAKAASR